MTAQRVQFWSDFCHAPRTRHNRTTDSDIQTSLTRALAAAGGPADCWACRETTDFSRRIHSAETFCMIRGADGAIYRDPNCWGRKDQ